MGCCETFGLSLLITIVIIIIMLIYNVIRSVKDNKENKSGSSEYIYKRYEAPNEFGRTNLDRFFIECVLSECNDFSKKANVEKAKLLANKYNLTYTSIESLYNEAYEAHIPISQKYEDERLLGIRTNERSQFEALNRYSDCYGTAKRVAMLIDQRDTLLKQAKSSDSYADFMVRSTQKAESDWAVWGGIANGLGGIGAGISTAVDIQAKNAEIRAQNAANLKAVMPAYMFVTNSASQNRANAELIEEEIRKTKLKLIDEMSPADIMNFLNITDETLSISETGAFKITASVSAKNGLKIYDEVPAYIDGTLIASIYDSGRKIGSAYMVLPINGVSDEKTGIVGMGITGANQNTKYTIKFSSHKLWLMEK